MEPAQLILEFLLLYSVHIFFNCFLYDSGRLVPLPVPLFNFYLKFPDAIDCIDTMCNIFEINSMMIQKLYSQYGFVDSEFVGMLNGWDCLEVLTEEL